MSSAATRDLYVGKFDLWSYCILFLTSIIYFSAHTKRTIINEVTLKKTRKVFRQVFGIIHQISLKHVLELKNAVN